ncbi:DNA mismatch repair protein MutL [[Haemophilus] ducreyi]|uniref:DNA mismatch repair endonuclease MutL n=1 Tax=Haemophilus ducreyi TaxID=730 RepID=UPI0007CDE1FA|nr:DNA mismatch repair endonuclease MutL [[Haemophilus] ducreyi]ANF71115.1 DNA mismatch repair protein MutL [[Haemophilus] ducreyi]ANF71703.1 DNA mismatch repair protein MutL [[Haemophilus] ducreyi]
MTQHLIHILPPQLANQIAAGEVVERPASVVKELVENSLDAGANHIQIDIEKGGAQLIRLRDNGCGIAKQDLTLALTRHATSKIATLADLEMILSLGFRGEALASISSVSRLTLTSRTANQTEAWQAYTQGREMNVEIQPASHPVGTTIEVANLFFNTPARRKFLRTDKTEFNHIDEVVRRIALAKPTISFTLTHNGKIIRQYRKVADQSVAQQQKRVAAICGNHFLQQATHIEWQHGDLHLYGWVSSPQLARPQNDLSYSYVNGRVMRDKIINHAVRQAYAELIPTGDQPAFILFLDLNPTELDVNVHPAKHEVRFHQARLIHDFILQGVQNALQAQLALTPTDNQTDSVAETKACYTADNNRAAAGSNIFSSTPYPRYSGATNRPTKTAQQCYAELINTDKNDNANVAPIIYAEPLTTQATPAITETADPYPHHSQVLALVENKALLLKEQEHFYVVPLKKLAQLQLTLSLAEKKSQPLLIPLSLSLDQAQAERWQQYQAQLLDSGFEIKQKHWQGQTRLSIIAVPQCLRQQNLQQLLLQLFNQHTDDLADFFAKNSELMTTYSLPEGIRLIANIEQQAKTQLADLKLAVDFSAYLT